MAKETWLRANLKSQPTVESLNAPKIESSKFVLFLFYDSAERLY